MAIVHKKFATLIFVTLMVFAMSLVISLSLTLLRSGFSPGFFTLFLRAWALSALVAWPFAMVIVPVVRRIVTFLTT